MRSQFQQQRAARDELVDTIRSYGMVLLAALVLLPPPVIGMGVVFAGIVYLFMRHVGHSGHGRMPTANTG